jgi:pyruvate formate lyase activating enzyme
VKLEGPQALGAWVEELGDSRLRCRLCPHHCELKPGARGICRVRVNVGGKLELPEYGLVSSIALDPIEKKPLYRFLPGTRTFSAGFFGCNLRCPFCQNWEISQTEGDGGKRLSPEKLVDLALDSGLPSLSFTYSEPTVHQEYLVAAATVAKTRGLRTILVTNGNLNREPAVELLSLIDAVNLDIKCFSPEVYARRLSGSLETVLEFARQAARLCWLEVTTLVVPGLEDWESAIDGIGAFLRDLSPEIALHLSAYHPSFRYDEPPTAPGLLHSLAAQARGFLSHVYEGNLAGERSEERCPSCKALLIRRRGYQVEVGSIEALPGGGVSGGIAGGRPQARCAGCGQSLFFVL